LFIGEMGSDPSPNGPNMRNRIRHIVTRMPQLTVQMQGANEDNFEAERTIGGHELTYKRQQHFGAAKKNIKVFTTSKVGFDAGRGYALNPDSERKARAFAAENTDEGITGSIGGNWANATVSAVGWKGPQLGPSTVGSSLMGGDLTDGYTTYGVNSNFLMQNGRKAIDKTMASQEMAVAKYGMVRTANHLGIKGGTNQTALSSQTQELSDGREQNVRESNIIAASMALAVKTAGVLHASRPTHEAGEERAGFALGVGQAGKYQEDINRIYMKQQVGGVFTAQHMRDGGNRGREVVNYQGSKSHGGLVVVDNANSEIALVENVVRTFRSEKDYRKASNKIEQTQELQQHLLGQNRRGREIDGRVSVVGKVQRQNSALSIAEEQVHNYSTATPMSMDAVRNAHNARTMIEMQKQDESHVRRGGVDDRVGGGKNHTVEYNDVTVNFESVYGGAISSVQRAGSNDGASALRGNITRDFSMQDDMGEKGSNRLF
jgi:hypothetical protein